VSDALRMLAAADLARWDGLPAALTLDEAASVLALGDGARGEGTLGEERRPARWTIAESATFEGGLYVWHADGEVLVVEGRDPVDAAGEPLAAPDLGEPETRLDTVLDRLHLPGGERVFASRGLALRVNPENDLLLGVVGFAPASVEDYTARLRPELPPRRLLPHATSHGSAW